MATSYSSYYVMLSIIVAVLSSYVAMDLAQNITSSQGRLRSLWLLFGTLAMGLGIWSMHFIGMLAFDMNGMPMAYDIPLMALSIIIALAGSALALYIVSREKLETSSYVIGSFAMAAAIAGMHYVGMFSMRMDAHIEWDWRWILISIIIAVAASFLALRMAFQFRKGSGFHWQKLLASLIMGFAIAGMHYTGMFAAHFHHADVAQDWGSQILATSSLGVLVTTLTLIILGISLLGSFLNRIFKARSLRAEKNLQASEERFRQLVEAIRDYAIYSLDAQGHISLWPPGASVVTGYQSHEVIGRHFSMFYPLDEQGSEGPEEELRVARETGHFETTAMRRRKNGSLYWANIVITPVHDDKGEIRGFTKITRDISQIRAAEDRIRKQNEELEVRVRERTKDLADKEGQLLTLANALPMLVMRMDPQLKIQFINEAFAFWLNRTPADMIGKRLSDVMPGEPFKQHKPYIEIASLGQVVSYERKNSMQGEETSFNVTLVPEFNDDRQVAGLIMVATDITKHKAIEAELKEAKEAAEVANATKSAFLANMSHEIRTPLGAILGFSELLAQSELTEEERASSAEVIKRNGRLLSGIINDILDLSKVEAGKLEVEKLNLPFAEVVAEIESLMKLETSEKYIAMRVHVQSLVPRFVKTDPIRLRQILLNIVGNAIKFTKEGSVDIFIKMDDSADLETPKLLFIVKDTGRGIRPDQVNRLFIPFNQADVSTTRAYGGTGLGLALSKKLAMALGGDVSLTYSEPGIGSSFCIAIEPGPAELYDYNSNSSALPTLGAASAAMAKELHLNQRRILVVDDSPDNLVLAQHFLKKTGAIIELASNGKEGLERAMANNFNLVFMDIQMPGMDGFEATRELRRRGFKSPIVALTAHAMLEERKRCLDNGFNEHLSKPINREALLALVERYVQDPEL